jgi:hypothetical protein
MRRRLSPNASSRLRMGLLARTSLDQFRASPTTVLTISIGIVYAAVFVTQLLPQDNPVMQGFGDGARAAMASLKGA